MIDGSTPTDWRDLQVRVARILGECGFQASVEHELQTVRGSVVVDVYAEDSGQTPPATYVFECKNWKRRVPKSVVHSLRTVVSDTGVNWGVLVTSRGFQVGAREAAERANVRLLTWEGFEALFEQRWIERHLLPTLKREDDALVEYTEPINSRIMRKAEALSDERQGRFRVLRARYEALAMFSLSFRHGAFSQGARPTPLTGAATFGTQLLKALPLDVMEAVAHRDFLDRLVAHLRHATAQFDELFGERA